MFQSYARCVTRFRWLIIALWLLLVVAAMALLPNLNNVVAHKNTTFLPDSSETMQAQKLVQQVDPKHHSQSTVLVAIHNDKGLTSGDSTYFESTLNNIEQNKDDYSVTMVQDAANTDKSAKQSFISKDNKTEIAIVGLSTDITSQKTPDVLARIQHTMDSHPTDAKVYFTGDLSIQEDDMQLSQKGAEKTAIVTVVLVLVILLAVFRSVLAPFLTLLSIGLSFVVSSGVVAWFAERGLPVSNFTQTFLIAVLFGAGTDYSIIILNRFREELTKHHSKEEALHSALAGVGKTVIFSAATVLVSFAVLYLANFGLYRSAVGVAIGVLITLITCLTLIPALMGVLGPYLYWPRRPVPGASHHTSRVWSASSRIATRRPWWTLFALCVVLTPIALLFSNDRTFDPMEDIPNSTGVAGFHVVADAFGSGHAMPTTIVLDTDANLRTSEGLTTINGISRALLGVTGVNEVDSATQPVGKALTDFQLASQNAKAADGLLQVRDGLGQLGLKLGKGGSQVGNTQGLIQLQQGAGRVTSGAGQLQTGASQLASSASKLTQALQQTGTGAVKLQEGLNRAAEGAAGLSSDVRQSAAAQTQLAALASNLADAMSAWVEAHPGTSADPSWQQILVMAQQLQQGGATLAGQGQQLSQAATQLASSMAPLAKGANEVATATGAMANGAGQLASGANQLADGAAKLTGGSQQVATGIGTFVSSLDPLATQLQGAQSGVQQLTDGVGTVQDFLTGSGDATAHGDPGFYVPTSVVSHNQDLGKAMDAYISPDGHVAKFTVILDANPYSMKAIEAVPQVEQAARAALATGPIHDGNILAGGTTATQAELNRVSNQDFVRTMVLVMVAIFLLLVFMLRSVLTPLYILVSLAAAYFVTMGILQTIAVHVLHHAGVSWAVPFFVFLLLVALGVDYSIFLMSRFDEEYRRGMSAGEAIRAAMANMGNVVFSAALIMAGTFGSMTASGMTTMVEIGISIIIGLLLYAVVVMAFFVPASATIFGHGHAWPFHPRVERTASLRTGRASLQE